MHTRVTFAELEQRAASTQPRAVTRSYLREQLGSRRTFFAGRLANYLYIDMDDCMRQALDAGEEILEALRASA